MSFAITWPYYSSNDTTSSPYIPNIGAAIHCHFLPHNDSNSMMITYGIKPLSNIISNICFPAGTPIKTDQGYIPIETILPNIHTINNKKIINITETVSLEDYLVCFEKNSLGYNIPSEKTVLSKKHKIFYNDKMVEAVSFIGISNDIHKVEYNGEILYNVLMEDYDKMLVNNLICETLHPDNIIVKINKLLNNFNSNDEYEKIIKTYNNFCITKA